MTPQKKLEMLEELFELETGVLNADTVLSELDAWDSMAKLSLIVMMDDEFNKSVTSAQIRELKTVQDILDLMV